VTTAIQWLLDDDLAIRWQTMRDLLRAAEPAVEREPGRVSREGCGARLLAKQDPAGLDRRAVFGRLRDFGLPPRSRDIRHGDGPSNLAARKAAHQQGDTGEELHAMDYLVYAYLQSGREREAAQVVQELKDMSKLNSGDFKVGYASTAMPIRYAVERRQWAEAAIISAPAGAPPQVVAIAVWARGLGLGSKRARGGGSRGN
jgi:hypothetical protein